jgi:hypothetical protein
MFNTNTINLQEPAVSETLTHLAAELKRQPHFTALEKAYREFQADQHAQDLLTRARTLQQQLRYSWTDEDRAELDQLTTLARSRRWLPITWPNATYVTCYERLIW